VLFRSNDVTELEVSVYLENQCALVISPGLVARLSLDFDLKSSNIVSFDLLGNAGLVVEPNLIAEIDKASPKIERIRGLLNDVNVDESFFDVKICPFFHKFKEKNHRFGETRVYTGAETIFSINGIDLAGEEGLEALADVDEDTPVLIKGNMNHKEHRFEAREVYVGESVPGADEDVVTGSVLSRNGNTLAVNGLVWSENGEQIRLNDTVEVTLSEATVVKKQGSTDEFSISDIAPGQHICITGTLSINESETPSLDATAGTARLLLTTLRGHVAQDTVESDLNIELGTINFRKAELFDFTGTGIDSANDADPDSYEVETGLLDTSVFDLDDPIKVYGFVNAFGAAPYDFEATKVVNYDILPSILTVKWSPSTTEPFESMTDESIVVDLSPKNVFHFLCKADVDRDEQDLVTLVPAEQGVYVIKMRKNAYVYKDFTDFVAKLDELLDGYNRMRRLFTTGGYDESDKTLTATYLSVEIR
jgi:hypothetical protein